jgi:hypothetical protein
LLLWSDLLYYEKTKGTLTLNNADGMKVIKKLILITLLITLLGSWLPSLIFNGFQTLENAGSVRIPYAPPF